MRGRTRRIPSVAGRTAFLAALVAILALPVARAAQPSTPGTLQARNEDGWVVEMPLRHTRVSIEVAAYVARATVEQVFLNPFRVPVEAVYTFPLGDTAAVDDYEIQVGPRTIRGEIRRREEARRVYERAKSDGYQAALLEQERPNVFTQSVANLEPGHEIVVRIRTVEVLKYEAGFYELVFPLVVGSRYVPGDGLPGGEALAGTSGDDPAVSTRKLGLRMLKKGFRSGHDVEIDVRIDAGVPIRSLSSVSHEIEIERPDPPVAEVRLSPGDRIPNKDFILRWDVSSEDPEVALLAHRTGVDGYFTLLVQPTGTVTAEQAAPKEIVLLLDTSGSMEGIPLRRSKAFAREVLRTLGPTDTFNVVRFAGGSAVFSRHPVGNRTGEVDRAIEWMERFEGRGGTEMLGGLRRAVEHPVEPGRYRLVVVLTDGFIGNEREILAEIDRLPDDVRVFPVGIGTSVNHYLLDRMADTGGGAYTFVSTEAEGPAALNRFRDWVTRPYLTGLEIDWGPLPVLDVLPEGLHDLFAGQNLALVGRYAGAGRGEIVIRGWLSGRPWENRLVVDLPDREDAHAALGSVWARHRIRQWLDESPRGVEDDLRERITRLALEHRLLSPYTSFVAVDDTVVLNPAGDPARVRQAVPPPKDTSIEATPPSQEMTENVVVTARRNVIDLDRVASNAVFRDEFIQDLPVSGRFYANVITMAPGVAAADGDGSPNVHGSRARGFRPIVSGVSAVDPVTGAILGNVAANSIEKMEIVTAGAGVSFGRSHGGFARVIQKQGSNEFEGDAAALWGSDLLDGSRPGAPPATERPGFGSTGLELRVSGPIAKDRLWYRVALDSDRRDDPVDVLRGLEVVSNDRDLVSGRLTWQVSARNKLSLQIDTADADSDGLRLGSLTRRSATGRVTDRGRTATLAWTAPYSAKILVETWLAYRSVDESLFPSMRSGVRDCGGEIAGAPTALHCNDTIAGAISGGFPLDGSEGRDVASLRSRVELYGGRALGAGHDLLLGVEWEAEDRLRSLDRGPELFRFAGPDVAPTGIRETLVARLPAGPATRGEANASRSAAFFEDRIRFDTDLVLTVGVRLDREQVETAWRDVVARPVQRQFGDTAWSPQVSLSWLPFPNGKLKLAAEARRHHDGMDPAIVLMEALPPVRDVALDPAAPVWPGDDVAEGEITGIRLDEILRLPRMDEWSLGVEREIATETLLSVRAVDRSYREQLRLAPGEDGFFLLGNRGREDVRSYVIEIDRRRYRGWELQASYAWTGATGDGEPVDPWSLDREILLLDRPGFPSDRVRHDVKVQGATLATFGFRIGGTVKWQSGRPFTEYVTTLDATGRHPLLVPVGGVRNGLRNRPRWDVDLRLTRELYLARGAHLLLAVEILDLLDDETYAIFNPALGRGRRIDGLDDAFRRFGRRYLLEVRLRF